MAAEARVTATGDRITIAEVRDFVTQAAQAGLPDDTIVGPILIMRTRLKGLVAPPPWLPAGDSQAAQQAVTT